MNENYQKWFQSGQMVDRKLDENQQIVQNVPGLASYHLQLKSELPVIAQLDQILNRDSTAQTFTKYRSREELIVFMLDLSRKMTAAGHIIKNGILEKSSKMTRTSLNNSNDASLISRARNISDLIQEYSAELAPYGVDQVQNEKLANFIQVYSKISLEPKYTRAEHREGNQKMKEIFSSFKDTLKSIDLVIETVRISDPDFYRAVREVRRLESNRGANINLAGKIYEETTKKPVNNVKITLIPEIPEVKGVEMMVMHRSGFRIKNLDSGFYLLKAYKPGYKEFEQRVTIISNERFCIDIFLEKE